MTAFLEGITVFFPCIMIYWNSGDVLLYVLMKLWCKLPDNGYGAETGVTRVLIRNGMLCYCSSCAILKPMHYGCTNAGRLNFWTVTPDVCGALRVKRPAWHRHGFQNFEVAAGFLGNLCALVPYPTMQCQISTSAPAFCTHSCSLKDTRAVI